MLTTQTERLGVRWAIIGALWVVVLALWVLVIVAWVHLAHAQSTLCTPLGAGMTSCWGSDASTMIMELPTGQTLIDTHPYRSSDRARTDAPLLLPLPRQAPDRALGHYLDHDPADRLDRYLASDPLDDDELDPLGLGFLP